MADSKNVEQIVIEWLTENRDDSWSVSGDMPTERPDKFILVDRNGGGRAAMVLDRAEILIEVYCKTSRPECSAEASDIGDKIIQLEAYESITHASVNSIVNLPDTIGQYFRYQVYCDVWCRR